MATAEKIYPVQKSKLTHNPPALKGNSIGCAILSARFLQPTRIGTFAPLVALPVKYATSGRKRAKPPAKQKARQQYGTNALRIHWRWLLAVPTRIYPYFTRQYPTVCMRNAW